MKSEAGDDSLQDCFRNPEGSVDAPTLSREADYYHPGFVDEHAANGVLVHLETLCNFRRRVDGFGRGHNSLYRHRGCRA
jgi:hypothetical protein